MLLKTLNATVHHEMLAPLKGNLELSMRLNRSVKSKMQKKMAQTIFISTQLLMMHANDLLDQRVIEQGSFNPTISPTDVYQTIIEMVQVIRCTLTHREVKIIFEKPQIPDLNLDRRRLQQVVLNLLSNASKFTTKGDIKILVNLSRDNHGLFLEVKILFLDEDIFISVF